MTKTVMPLPDISSIRCQKRRREIGSTPLVGSSRNTTFGWCSTAQASARRCFQPPGSSPREPVLLALEPGHADRPGLALARLARRAGRRRRRRSGCSGRTRQVVVEAEALAHVADAALHAFRVAGHVDAERRSRARSSAPAGRTASGSSSTCPRRSRRGSRRSRPRRRSARRGPRPGTRRSAC